MASHHHYSLSPLLGNVISLSQTHLTSLHRHLIRLLLLLLLLLGVTVPLLTSASSVASHCKKPPVIFNFGDSNSDTGGLVAGLGFSVNLPNGRSFFRKSTGRLSDGRLLIDFLCQSVNASLLRPYLDSLASSKFTNGANFAIVGSSTLPKFLPFSLNIQVLQFIHFKARSLELVASGSPDLINEEGFRNALYIIDIGQNDISDSFAKNLSYPRVVQRIPSVVLEIENAMRVLYSQGGARKFWIHNTGPLGCLPQKLASVQKRDLDPYGCISSYNEAAKLFNQGLRGLCQRMKSQLTDASVVYVDMYSIKYDLIANSPKYGFASPLMACCGNGGPPYNYNIRVKCGQPGYKVCEEEGSRFVSWDGIHYTEAANAFIASKVLSTAYSSPATAFDFFCRA